MEPNLRNINDVSTEPWMTDLSAWADAFDIFVNVLTHNKSHFLVEDNFDQERLWLDSVPISTLYQPRTGNYGLTEFAFFILSDDWDEQSLIRLKDNTGVSLLLGLQTDRYHNNDFDVIDSIISCSPDEVQQVMKVFEILSNSRHDLVAIDFNILKDVLKNAEPAHFVQSIAFGSDRLDRTKQSTAKVLKQIPENTTIGTLILRIKSYDDLLIEDLSIINNALDNRVTEETNIWYGNGHMDEQNCCQIEVVYWIE